MALWGAPDARKSRGEEGSLLIVKFTGSWEFHFFGDLLLGFENFGFWLLHGERNLPIPGIGSLCKSNTDGSGIWMGIPRQHQIYKDMERAWISTASKKDH